MREGGADKSTVALERGLLCYLMRNRSVLQSRFQSCRAEWFGGNERKILWELVSRAFEGHRDLLSDDLYESYLLERFPDAAQSDLREALTAERSLILQKTPDAPVDALIARLAERQVASGLQQLAMKLFDATRNGDIEGGIDLLRQGMLGLRKPNEAARMVSLWGETDDWVEEVCNRRDHPDRYTGVPTGFPTFDRRTGGLFPSELTLVFGLAGKGKSTFMKQIGVNARQAGYNVLHCGNEEDLFQMRTKYISVETGIKYSHWKRGKFDDDELERFRRYREEQLAGRGGRLFVYTFPQQTDVTMIERKLVELRDAGERIDLCIVDYMDLMSSVKKGYNENDESGRIAGDLKQLAIDFHIPVFAATQAAQEMSKKEGKDNAFLDNADVFGSKRKVHTANMLVGMLNNTAKDNLQDITNEEITVHKVDINITKNRDGSNFKFKTLMYAETGRFVEADGDPFADLAEANGDSAGTAFDEARRDGAAASDKLAETLRRIGGMPKTETPFANEPESGVLASCHPDGDAVGILLGHAGELEADTPADPASENAPVAEDDRNGSIPSGDLPSGGGLSSGASSILARLRARGGGLK